MATKQRLEMCKLSATIKSMSQLKQNKTNSNVHITLLGRKKIARNECEHEKREPRETAKLLVLGRKWRTAQASLILGTKQGRALVRRRRVGLYTPLSTTLWQPQSG